MSGVITPKYLCPKGYEQAKIGGRCTSLTDPWKTFGALPRIFAPALISETASRFSLQSSKQLRLSQDTNFLVSKYQLNLPSKEGFRIRFEQIISVWNKARDHETR